MYLLKFLAMAFLSVALAAVHRDLPGFSFFTPTTEYFALDWHEALTPSYQISPIFFSHRLLTAFSDSLQSEILGHENICSFLGPQDGDVAKIWSTPKTGGDVFHQHFLAPWIGRISPGSMWLLAHLGESSG